MQLTVLLIALICVRWLGVPSWLHIDHWVKPWLEAIAGKSLRDKPWLYWLIAALVPLSVAAYALSWSAEHSRLLEFILTTVILLYSIGRDDFKAQVQGFVAAVRGADESAIYAAAKPLAGRPDDEVVPADRAELYRQALLNAAYRAMERMFVVFFWFAMLGPLAALAYRILRIFYTEYWARLSSESAQRASDSSAEQISADEASTLSPEPSARAHDRGVLNNWPNSDQPLVRLMWLLEWPVVRALGVSFAITGNFISCMQRWRDSLLCFKTPSKVALGNAVGGALDIDLDKLDCEAICCEMETLQALFYRTGLFWLCALAIYLVVAL